MARIRQQHPQNYVSSGNIHTEFENLIRYLNVAERGNKTLGELLSVLFDEEGEFDGPIEFRLDPLEGLQYRVGEYVSSEDGWIQLATMDDLRGPSGVNLGFVEGPFFYNRQDVILSTGVKNNVAITLGGSGYVEAPTVTFSAPDLEDGTLPVATAVLTDDAVSSIVVDSPGSGYVTAPTITISDPPAGTTATATCSLLDELTDFNRVSYTLDSTVSDVVVYRNGILLRPVEYSKEDATDEVVLVAAALNDKITIYSIRSQSITNFRRQDSVIQAATSVVAFSHTTDEQLLVWRNGVLQEEDVDYIASATQNIITFLDPSGLDVAETVTVMTVDNDALKNVAGLMLEDRYTNGSGLILFNRLAIEDDQIPKAKVQSLATELNAKARLSVGDMTPLNPITGDLWLDIAKVPAVLKFYDGTQWLATSPESSLPVFVQSNAGQYVRVNGTGTALEYGNIDFSSLVPKTFMGAANGVATLDTSGKMPVNQLPEIFATRTISFFSVHEESAAAVPNKTFYVANIWKTKLRLDGLTHKLSAGTCTIQLAVDGEAIGSSFSVTTTRASVDMPTVIEIDGTNTGRRLELIVTNASAAESLEVGIAAATLSI